MGVHRISGTACLLMAGVRAAFMAVVPRITAEISSSESMARAAIRPASARQVVASFGRCQPPA